MSIDFGTEHGKRVLQELQTHPVIWLTTLGDGDFPQPNLVWFVHEDDHIIIYSKPDAKRLGHIQRNPRISLNFNSDPEGHQQSILLGTIAVDPSVPAVARNQDYIEKYADRIAEMGGTVESFTQEYSVPLRVTLTNLRGF